MIKLPSVYSIHSLGKSKRMLTAPYDGLRLQKNSEQEVSGGAKVQVTGHRSGHRLQATGQVTGHRSQATGQVTGHRLQVTGHRSGHRSHKKQ